VAAFSGGCSFLVAALFWWLLFSGGCLFWWLPFLVAALFFSEGSFEASHHI
jgi:hypothetical protein